EGGCKNLNYLDCVKNKTLTGHVIKTVRVLVPGLEVCQQNCFREGKCVSYNLGPVEGQIRTCELNAADHWTRPDFLAFKEGFEYCPIENRCSSNPCPEGRLCTPDFAWDTFNCDDGGWTQWGPWPDACILSTCLQTRKRSCSSPVPQRNGANCAGLGLETRKCKIPKTDISGCQSALGMEDGRITDSQINTSSTKNSNPASAARLNNINTSLRIGAWCADSKELGQYIQTNVGKEFLRIIDKCFPPSNRLHKIFSRNTVKISYSCMPNVARIIDGDNKRKLGNDRNTDPGKMCSCPKSTVCPLGGECLAKNIVYQATVTCGDEVESYVGLTATDFKARYSNHKASFKHSTKRNATEL
ncbi:hypothetical protein QZH41_008109, partial [Actinostola sp. cb2023]